MDPTTPSAPTTPEVTTTPAVETPVIEAQPTTQPTVEPLQVSPSAPQQVAPITPDENSFTTFDPSQLTDPNLQAAYRQMQSDYTRKMQEISASNSKYEQYAPILDAMFNANQSQEQLNPVVSGLNQQLKEAGYSDEAIELGKTIAQNIMGHFEQTRAQEQALNNFNTQVAEATKADPRLADTSLVYDIGDGEKATFGQIVEELVASDPNWREQPGAAIQKAIKKVDAMINTAKVQGKQELSQQATQKAQNFAPVNSSPQGAINSDQPMSLRDAIDAAQKQIGG